MATTLLAIDCRRKQVAMKGTGLFVLICGLLTGCGTVHFDVAQGERVKLLTRDDSTSIHIERKVWYALWGNARLTENHTGPIIEHYHLQEVKMATRQTLSDSVIDSFAVLLSFSRRTLIIEGNPRKEVSP